MPRVAWSVRSPLPYALTAVIFILVVASNHNQQSNLGDDRAHSTTPPAPWSAKDRTATNYAEAKEGKLAKEWSSFPYDPTDSLAYRNHLELTTSPPAQITHDEHLGFSNIYVLSLPHRTDRRDDMLKLASALGITITFIDAAVKDEPFFQWIAERVAETRKERVALMAKTRRVKPSKLGGLGIGSVWVSQGQDTSGRVPFPPMLDDRFPSGNWLTHLEEFHSEGRMDELAPSTPEVNITELLWDHREWLPLRQVDEGVMSTFWGHTRVLKAIVENEDESALVLEDDVDMEWDIERMWSRMRRKLPVDWDTVHLGSCWGFEMQQPAYLHPLLHKATSPKCLHGWAVSKKGAARLLSLLNNPWSAYATAVDVAVPSFIADRLLKSFSVEPPIIIQRKDGPSDLKTGSGTKWRGLLRDSTFERIWTDEGLEVKEDVWDPKNLDPGTKLRFQCIDGKGKG
ncbi:hypothetical protein T439DRAFT_329028 [Meredithblackwellia eburnea MCA 4105]